MTLQIFQLPHGVLYVNKSNTPECVLLGNNRIEVPPHQVRFVGAVSPEEMNQYFMAPHLWEAQKKIRDTIDARGCATVLLDASKTDKWGDQLLLTLLSRSFNCVYGADKISVHVLVPDKMARIWEGNTFIKSIHTDVSRSKRTLYDHVIDVNTVDLKCERKPFENGRLQLRNRAALYLEQLGLYAVNKTPCYTLTDEDRQWAAELVRDFRRPLIGVATHSEVRSRTYHRMPFVVEALNNANYDTIELDSLDDKGNYVFTFAEMMAIINECDVVVTGDSAVLHGAGALKKRIVGLFGHTEGTIQCDSYEKALCVQGRCSQGAQPCWWHLTCIPGSTYQEKADVRHVECLNDIRVATVVDAVKQQLSRPKKVFALMLTMNLLSWTKITIESLRSYHDLQLFVVDNVSTDGTVEWLTEQGVDFVSQRTSVCEAENLGVKKFLETDCDHLLLLNNDISLRYDCIDRLVDRAEQEGGRDSVLAVTAGLVEQTPFWAVDDAMVQRRDVETIIDLPHSAFSCTIFTRACFEKVGLFDERFFPRYIEDNDYILRMRLMKGRFLKDHQALYYHVLGGVVKTDEEEKKTYDLNWERNCNAFIAKWGLHPHAPQDLSKLCAAPECKTLLDRIIYESGRGVYTVAIKRWMGGVGDHIFLSVLAREIKFRAKNCRVVYVVPSEFRDVYLQDPYVDLVLTDANAVKADLWIDCTDVDYHTELMEMRKLGEVKTNRARIYLNIIGATTEADEHPVYYPSNDELLWAEQQWAFGKKRVVVAMTASNKLNSWPHMEDLVRRLSANDEIEIKAIDQKSGDKFLYSMRQAAALIGTADVVVAGNSGVANLAGAQGIPIVELNGSYNGRVFAEMFPSMIPLQGRCSVKDRDHCDHSVDCYPGKHRREKENIGPAPCLASMPVELVLAAVNSVIREDVI